jgi:hypothetical protein
MTKSELRGIIKSILKEELLREAEEATYNYTFFYAGSVVPEDKFKDKLVLVIKELKSIANTAAIPEAAEVITSGLKEGAEMKGVSVFELGDKTFIVKAKKGSSKESSTEDTNIEDTNI